MVPAFMHRESNMLFRTHQPALAQGTWRAHWRRWALCLGASTLAMAAMAQGSAPPDVVALPDPKAMQQRLSYAPQRITVVEPHLSVQKPHLETYRGFPATLVWDALLGPNWRKPGVDIEIRALDGFISRIPSQRFIQERAFLTFEREGHAQFTMDNPAQHQTNIPLAPWYLVWDNRDRPALIAEGALMWPYQSAKVRISTERQQALMPAGLPASWQAASQLTFGQCLSCHTARGFGGQKMPIDLTVLARNIPEADFVRWVLAPETLRPNTTMPALQERLPQAQREENARLIHRYLLALPPKP